MLTADGPAHIEDVASGTQVWAFNLNTQEWEYRTVVGRHVHDYDGDVVTIVLGDERLEATGNHPFWVVTGEGLAARPAAEDVYDYEKDLTSYGRWVEARHLHVGDQLLSRDGGIRTIADLEVRTERLPVCNLTVERIHCYTVGDVGVLVHNKPQKYDGGGSDERPPNLSPPGAKRRGAFREAKRRNNIPQGQQPSRVKPNLDKRGNPQPGKQYEFDTPEGTKTIRDDAGGHRYPDDPTQDRGPHFNDDAGNHYDY